MGFFDVMTKTFGMEAAVKEHLIDRAIRVGYVKFYNIDDIEEKDGAFNEYEWRVAGSKAYCYIPVDGDDYAKIEVALSSFSGTKKIKKEAK